MLSFILSRPRRAKEDAKEEKLRFSQCDASRAGQVHNLETQLKEEKQKGLEGAKVQSTIVAKLEEQVHHLEERSEKKKQKDIESGEEQSTIVAKFKERIVRAECDWDDAHYEFEKEQSSSSALTDDLAKAK